MEQSNALNKASERLPISAFIITFNEELHIGPCIESLNFCDEIVVIDSFSSDKTVEICNSHGVRLIQRSWPGYRDQKAFGLESCTHEWILNLDADERVSDELRRNIIEVLETEYQKQFNKSKNSAQEIHAYDINRVVFYLGRWWRRGGWYPEYRTRLMQKSHVKWGGTDPHEKPIVSGNIAVMKGELQHFTYRNMDEQFRRLLSHSSIAAKEDFKRGRRTNLASLLLNPVLRSFKFYVLKKGYREGMAGLIVAIIEGYYTFMKYAKLWEYQTRQKSTSE